MVRDFTVVVPVFNPEPGLIPLVEALAESFAQVVVVDDGSVENAESFSKLPDCAVRLSHSVNRGKGRAMKTAVEWIISHGAENRGAIFADGDGQHHPADVLRVADRAAETDCVAIGVRDFSRPGIPFRSRLGNIFTSFLVRLIYGFGICDTQTGLRAIPFRLLRDFLALPGERYEFEMRLFGFLRSKGEPLEQIPIETVYLESNRSSHFQPLRDTVRIYGAFFDRPSGKACCVAAAQG